VAYESYITHDTLATFGAERVNLSPERVRQYRDQANRVRSRIERHIADNPNFALVKILNSGSLAKGTALSTLNDFDLAVYVRSEAAPGRDPALVSWMAELLKEAYPELDDAQFIEEDHCVRIEFKTRGYVAIECVPVLYEGEPGNIGWLITKGTGARVKTSVSRHIEFIGKRKKEQPDHFAQVVRLLKWWAREQKQLDPEFRFKSFMIELICAHLADRGLDFSDYVTATSRFFAYIAKSELSERISFDDYYQTGGLPATTGAAIEIFDPVNAENNVASRYTETDRDRIVAAATEATEAIADAVYATTKGRAVEDWQDVLGPSFRAAA
jgi:tRNA nucleotidyltransferase (CCA-adding enzyme)